MNVEQRIAIERKVVRKLIRNMKEAGWVISRINDGGEPDENTLEPSETEAMECVFSVNESTIYFTKQLDALNKRTCFALIVLGNDGYDCIADHSCGSIYPGDDFETVMGEIQLWCDISEDC